MSDCVQEEDSIPSWLRPLLCLLLICFSGMFSGLTLGLMGLDKTQLRVIKESGTDQMKAYAEKIEPLRRNGNHLLSTLLLGNTAVNAALAIVMADMTSGFIGLVASTSFIVIFGEITPQAICSRHGLRIGANPVIYFILCFCTVALYALAYPISIILDSALGEEVGASYTKNELSTLLSIQQEMGHLTIAESSMLEHVIRFSYHPISEAMRPIADIFSINMGDVIDDACITKMLSTGFSRIPIYDDTCSKTCFKYLLFTKDLIAYNPADRMTVRAYVKQHNHELPVFRESTPMADALNIFKAGHGHMAIIMPDADADDLAVEVGPADAQAGPDGQGAPPGLVSYRTAAGATMPVKQIATEVDWSTGKAVGFVTLEGLIEVMIGVEIMDESQKRKTALMQSANPLTSTIDEGHGQNE